MEELNMKIWLFLNNATSEQIDELLKMMDDRESLQELKSVILQIHRNEMEVT